LRSSACGDPCIYAVVFGVAGVSSVGAAIVANGNYLGEQVQKQKKATSDDKQKFCIIASKIIYFYEG